jgi:MFS family permease
MQLAKIDKSSIEERKIRSNLRKLYLYHFLWAINTCGAVIVPFLLVWGRLSYMEVMLLQSYFTFIIFVLEIPSGAIADFFGKKRGLSLAAVVLVGAVLCYSLVPNLILFIIAETLWAFGIALISGTDEAFLYNTLRALGKKDELSRYAAKNRTVTLIASIISGPLGSIFAQFISLQFCMFFLVFTYSGAFFISLTFHEVSVNQGNSQNNTEKMRYISILKEGFKQLKQNKVLRILCFQRVLIEVLIFSMFWIYQPYLIQLNVPILYFGFIGAIISITNIVFTTFWPIIHKRSKQKARLLVTVDLITGTAFVILGFSTNLILGITFLLIVVAFGYPRYLLFIDGINKNVDSENRATVLSTINMFGSILRTIFFLFIGVIISWNVYVIFIVVGILIILLTLFSRVKNEYL